jgi:hypothetical protein
MLAKQIVGRERGEVDKKALDKVVGDVVSEVVGCPGERGTGGTFALQKLCVAVEDLEARGMWARRCSGIPTDREKGF